MRLLKVGIILALATAAYADIITLKSGRVINGTYLGGSAREVKIQEGDQIETVEVTQIAKIEFGNGTQAPAPNPDRPVLRRAPSSDGSDASRPTLRRAPGSDSGGDDAPPTLRRDTSSADDSRPTLRRDTTSASTNDSRPTLRQDTSSNDDSAPTLRRAGGGDAPQILRPDASEPSAASTAASVSQQRSPVEIPAGTNVVVRMIDGVDSDRDSVGTTFHASIDQAITVAGATIIPRGADAVVKLVDNKEAGKLTGRAEMTLSLVSIQYEGKMIDANTQTITRESDARGKSTAKKAGVGAVAGAVLGGLLGGGKGAAVGAAAGAGAGATVEAVSSGPHVKVPSETRLTFILDNALTI